MRLLLDECIPRRLALALTPHEVSHVSTLGWTGISNGELLAAMRSSGMVGLITSDKNLSFQQSIPESGVFVLVLVARSNRIADLQPLAPEVLRMLGFAQSGRIYHVKS